MMQVAGSVLCSWSGRTVAKINLLMGDAFSVFPALRRNVVGATLSEGYSKSQS
jgi:hypothetical protein